MKKIVSLVLILALCLGMTAIVSAADPMEWNKVTEAPADWSGAYLIVYEGEDGAKAFNPALGDVASNYADVTAAAGKITGDHTSLAVRIAKVEGGYSIQLPDGKYIGNANDKNAMTVADEALVNTITVDAEQGVLISGAAGATLRFNASKGQTRFRYFKNATYANQMPIALYKLDGVLAETEKPEGFDPTGKTPAEIVTAAFAMGNGEAMVAPATLTGTVVDIGQAYNSKYGNITLTITVEGKEIECYRATGDKGAELKCGDVITVTGTIKNYNGKVQFDKPTVDAIVTVAAPVEAPVFVETAAVGTYKWATVQKLLNKVLYFDGGISGDYLTTTDNLEKAVEIAVEATEGGFYLSFVNAEEVKTYISIIKNSKEKDVVGLTSEPTTIFVWNAEYKTFSAIVGEIEYYLGTYNNYATVGVSNIDYAATSNPMGLIEQPKPPVETPDVPEHGDNTAIFAMMAMMAVSAAAIVVLNKKRAF